MRRLIITLVNSNFLAFSLILGSLVVRNPMLLSSSRDFCNAFCAEICLAQNV